MTPRFQLIRETHSSPPTSQSLFLTLLVSLIIASSFPQKTIAKSAAESDWRVSNSSPPSASTATLDNITSDNTAPDKIAQDKITQDRAVQQQCRGKYVQPTQDIDHNPSGHQINASAKSILHVSDHSTTLHDDIHILTSTQEISGDFATIDAETQQYTVEGNIVLRQQNLLIQGKSASGSIFSNTAAIDGASFLLHQRRMRGTATKMAQTGDGNLNIQEGVFTTCEPDDNFWTVHGDSIELRPIEGYGVARNVTIKVKNLPIAYFPYFRFPIDDSRQSGFLVPTLGQDSDGGVDIGLSYYFNLAPEYDATYTPRSIWKRGLLHEGEFRYLTPKTSNIIAGTFLAEDDEYDDRLVIDASRPDDVDRQNRWLTYVKHRGRSGRWASSINYTSVSDIDYLHDLGALTGLESGIGQTRGSGNSAALARTGSVTYTGIGWQSRLEMLSFQQLSQTQPEQYQTLPRLTISRNQKLGGFSVVGLIQASEFDKDSERNTSQPIVGSRIATDVDIKYPLRNSWGFLTPALRIVHRNYHLDDASTISRNSASITTTSASLDAGVVFERQTQISSRHLLQTLEPRIFYLHTADKFQDDLPLFDSTQITPSYTQLFRNNRFTGYDRIGDANQFGLGLTTEFSSLVTGEHLLSASIGQLFYLDDRTVNLAGSDSINPAASASPVFLRLQSQLSNLTVNASYEFDTDKDQSNRGYLSLRYQTSQQAIVNINYTFTDESMQRNSLIRHEEESDLSFMWPLKDSWRLIGRWNYGWNNRQTIESLLGLEYNDCCWRARVIFKRSLDEPRLLIINTPGQGTTTVLDNRADSGVYFEFQLKGLASLGGKLNALLEDAIFGYRESD